MSWLVSTTLKVYTVHSIIALFANTCIYKCIPGEQCNCDTAGQFNTFTTPDLKVQVSLSRENNNRKNYFLHFSLRIAKIFARKKLPAIRYFELEPQGAPIAHLSTMSTSVIS